MSPLILDQLVYFSYFLQVVVALALVLVIRWYLKSNSEHQQERCPLKKALVVDDDHDILKLANKVLSKKGIDVVCTDDGDTALALIDEFTDFDILITDIYMPSMDGIELSANLHQKIPILIISSGPKNSLLESIYQNSDAHINKIDLRHKLFPYALQAIENWKSFHRNRDSVT